ncbi:alpha/beta hydrolase [Telmatospirillum siberiense]|uniref:Alpha/beta hydrolase n=1 Tax=Telmatospirillum siberiense TaxID=382514 RepID=A0A2N3PVW8_9PROT|nr:alpha/beta fold hydrolase [Telmatospirillum siberiense]PKU24527.1 alpha/beta hydrolase [Telmatospirillum siberiense]
MKLEIFRCQPPRPGPDYPPVLFIHGSYCGAWVWTEKFMPYFAERGFSGLALSLRGHGASEGALAWASMADYLADVASAAEELDGPPIVIGHSMGGLIAQHYLVSRPTAAAVLLGSLPPSGLGSSAMHMSMFAPDVLWQLGLLQSLGPEAISTDVIHRAFFTRQTPPDAVRHLMPKLQAESHRISADLLCPDQPKLSADHPLPPVLVLGGDADVFLPTSAFRETATFLRGDLQILHGAPHGLMLDTAWWQPTADAIIAWLGEKGVTKEPRRGGRRAPPTESR